MPRALEMRYLELWKWDT